MVGQQDHVGLQVPDAIRARLPSGPSIGTCPIARCAAVDVPVPAISAGEKNVPSSSTQEAPSTNSSNPSGHVRRQGA